MTRIEIRPPLFLMMVVLMLVSRVVGAHDDRDGVRFQGALHATSKVVELSTAGGENRCKSKGQPTLRAWGAGDTNLFGSVYIEQSHCIGDLGTFTDGVFKLSKMPPPLPPAHRALVEGVYCGNLVPTFNSKFPNQSNPSPSGTWLIAGNVCIVSVGGRAVSDCNQQCPKGYEPATGITTLPPGLDGPATIFLDQVIRFKQGH